MYLDIRTLIQQQLDQREVVFFGGDQQGLLALWTCEIWIRTLFKQVNAYLFMSLPYRPAESCQSFRVYAID